MLYALITVFILHSKRSQLACLSNLVAMLDERDKDIHYHIALKRSLN